MAFGVTKWPRGADPRSPSFGMRGFAWGAVPPWIWEVSTTGALPPFEDLNDGVYLSPLTVTDVFVDYHLFPFGAYSLELRMEGQNRSIPDQAEDSKQMTFKIRQSSSLLAHTDKEESYPAAIKQWTLPPVVDVPPFEIAQYLPNPLVLTPVAWDGVQ
jgi:hypothetical protein